MPNRKPAFESMAARLLIFFLENPDEELTSTDVKTKFGVITHDVRTALRGGLDLGLFARRCEEGRGMPATYMAGPRLLQALRAGAAPVDHAAARE